MTYCVGIMLDTGLIFASDSRTHAEVDNFARFCKMTVFERAGDRVLVLLSSGNLAGTQAVISLLKQRNARDGALNLWSAESMFDAAMLVGLWQMDREDLLAGMLLFRFLYYIAPFVVSVILLTLREVILGARMKRLRRAMPRLDPEPAREAAYVRERGDTGV